MTTDTVSTEAIFSLFFVIVNGAFELSKYFQPVFRVSFALSFLLCIPPASSAVQRIQNFYNLWVLVLKSMHPGRLVHCEVPNNFQFRSTLTVRKKFINLQKYVFTICSLSHLISTHRFRQLPQSSFYSDLFHYFLEQRMIPSPIRIQFV